MQATGFVRRVDELGRVTLPVELRRAMGLTEKDALEVYMDGGSLVLRKHSAVCTFCGGTRGLKHLRGKSVCADCLRELLWRQQR